MKIMPVTTQAVTAAHMTSAQRTGTCLPIPNSLASHLTKMLSLLLQAATTTMARSKVPGTGTGGPLLRTMPASSTTCATVVVACLPATTTSAAGTMSVASAHPSVAVNYTLISCHSTTHSSHLVYTLST